MKLLLDSFWRAAMYCFHPRVLAMTLLPLILLGGAVLGLAYFFGNDALEWVRQWMVSRVGYDSIVGWMDSIGMGAMQNVLPHLAIIVALTPLLVLLTLLLSSWMMTPSLVSLVGERRFPNMERKHGGGFFSSVFWSFFSFVIALLVLSLSAVVWLPIVPLSLVVPPLVWGWLTYRILSYDALAVHANKDERKKIVHEHRGWLMVLGVVAGYLAMVPTIIIGSSVMAIAFFTILAPLAIWLYVLTFAFASLWFAHYCLAALEKLRKEELKTIDVEAAKQHLGVEDASLKPVGIEQNTASSKALPNAQVVGDAQPKDGSADSPVSSKNPELPPSI